MQCPTCDAMGCELCHDGKVRITQCPRQCVDASTWAMVGDIAMAKRGFLPVSGGTLDQTESFCAAWMFWMAEEGRMAKIENGRTEKIGHHPRYQGSHR